MPDTQPPPTRERIGNRLLRGVRDRLSATADLVRHPSTIPAAMRRSAVAIWASRGGGFYGLGYAVSLVWAEARTLANDLFGDESLGDTLLEQAFQLLFRFSEQSLTNLIEAFAWPARLLETFGGWGILALVGGFALFDPVLRPLVEQVLPELRVHREAREQKLADKAAAKQLRKAQRAARWQARKQQLLRRNKTGEPTDDDIQPQ